MVRHCIRHQCFISLPNVWVVFKIYFAILHKIVAINNIQQSIRLNKQREKNKVFALLHYIRLAMLHIRVFLEWVSLDWTLHVLKYFMTSIRRQSNKDLTFSFTEILPQSLWYITASGANILFYCQMSGYFLKYILPFFIIVLQEITFNKVLD